MKEFRHKNNKNNLKNLKNNLLFFSTDSFSTFSFTQWNCVNPYSLHPLMSVLNVCLTRLPFFRLPSTRLGRFRTSPSLFYTSMLDPTSCHQPQNWTLLKLFQVIIISKCPTSQEYQRCHLHVLRHNENRLPANTSNSFP